MDRHSDNVQTDSGRAVAGASVRVLDVNGQLATIFADRAGTPLANPITTDTLGRWSFCAADGLYSAQVYVGGVLKATVADIRLEDPSDGFVSLAAPGGAALVGNTPAGTIAATTVQGAINELAGDTAALTALKDAANGYPGLTGYSINFKNAAATFTSSLANTNTAARTYTFPDKSGTVMMTSDLPAAYTLPVAAVATLGGVKVGSGLAIDGAGVLSATGLTPGSVGSVNTVTPVSGNVTLTTDNIAESGTPTNQWFTAARVRAVVLTGLSTATNAVITAADTVLGMAGKLQAQISANTSAITANTTALGTKQDTTAKDATGGYAGLTGYSINFKNAANTFTSLLANANTAIRTYTFPDKNGTVAMLSDVPGVVLTAQFQSTDQTITSNTTITLSHGLGTTPKILLGYLKCIASAANGYAVGDVVPVPLTIYDCNGAPNGGVSVVADATNLYINFSGNSSCFTLRNKGSNSVSLAFNSNFAFLLKAFA